MELRRYAAADAAGTLAVFRAAVERTAAAHYSSRQRRAWAPPELDPETWSRARSAVDTWVAVRNGEVAGFGDIDGSGHINMLYVHPDHGRSGVAAALLEHLTGIARRSGLAELTVEASLTARPVFERHGFRLVSEQTVERHGEKLLNFRMRRPLTP